LGHKQKDVAAGRDASRNLHRALGPLLTRPGVLLTASCTSRIGDADLLDDAIAGLRLAGRQVSRVLRRGGPGEDHPVPPTFPEGRYLHCLTLRVE
jgi:23S rRNA G2069 N7-methylase RlmK/C1962 C5-methylase RlmI